MNDSGDVSMRAMVDSLRKLGRLPQEAAKAGAPLVEAVAKADAKAGVDPMTGNKWLPKKTGGQALINAANAIKGAAVGALIQLRLAFPESIHQRGTEYIPQRRVIPSGGGSLPKRFAKAVIAAARQAFQELTRG